MIEHQNTNAKIQVLYSNGYGDAPHTSVPSSGLTIEDATRREFDAHSVIIATAQSISNLKASVTSLFSTQALITNDVKLMSEASAQTREDMNLILLNQQKIIDALKLPTQMIRTLTTSVAAAPAPSFIHSSFTRPDNKLKGEKMVGPSEA